MLNTTNLFKEAAKADLRSAHGFVMVDFANEWSTYPFATATASTTAAGYTASNACDGRISATDHVITGSYISYAQKKGWKGTLVSNGTGVLSSTETITLTYAQPVLSGNIWVVGTQDAYPVDFQIFVNGVLKQTVVANDQPVYGVRITPLSITTVSIVISKVYPAGASAQIIEFGAITTVIFENDNLVSLNILEELSSYTDTAFSGVVSNEATVELDNSERWFTPTNVDSPFYGLIRPKIRMRPYMGFEIADNNVEVVPMGIFRSETWDAPAQTQGATTVGYDKLYSIYDKPVPMVKARRDGNTIGLIRDLLNPFGITDIASDDFLWTYMQFGWLPTGTVRDALDLIAQSGFGFVNVGRTDQALFVTPEYGTLGSGAPVTVWDDEFTLFDTVNQQRFTETYSKVTVKWATVTLGKETEILRESAHIVPPGISTMELAEFSDPIWKVSQVNLLGLPHDGITITSINHGANNITIQFNNAAGSQEQVDVQVKGLPIEVSQKAIDRSLPNKPFTKELVLDNVYMQNFSDIDYFLDVALEIVSDPAGTFEITHLGDPSIELGDVVQLVDNSSLLGTHNCIVISQQFTLDGGLSATATLRKQIGGI